MTQDTHRESRSRRTITNDLYVNGQCRGGKRISCDDYGGIDFDSVPLTTHPPGVLTVVAPAFPQHEGYSLAPTGVLHYLRDPGTALPDMP
jgi:hypothetical protein